MQIKIDNASGRPVYQQIIDQIKRDIALGRLTPDQREAFILKHVEGRSYEEMSAVLDIPRASLKMRVHRAREALKELMEDFR